MKPVIDYTLYLVTDRDLMSTETLEQAVEAACAGGLDGLLEGLGRHEITVRDQIERVIDDGFHGRSSGLALSFETIARESCASRCSMRGAGRTPAFHVRARVAARARGR